VITDSVTLKCPGLFVWRNHFHARYVTGYLGDVGVPPLPDPMDFSAWFEVYLTGRWTVLMRAQPTSSRSHRDWPWTRAADVPMHNFRTSLAREFEVVTNEISIQSKSKVGTGFATGLLRRLYLVGHLGKFSRQNVTKRNTII
jgi:hypothetical protein